MPRIDAKQLNLEETVVKVDRVAKVVKGGKRFNFRALVVVGDRNGHVGMGLGKSAEVPDAIRKATEDARKRLISVPLSGTTIPYMVRTTFSASEVMLKPAAPGTGVIAGGAVRAVVEAAGIRDVLTKSFGHSELNTVTATIEALRELMSPDVLATRRNRSLADVIGQKAATRYAEVSAQSLAPAPEPERNERPRRDRGERGGSGGGRGGDNRGGGGAGRGGDSRGGGNRGGSTAGPVARQPLGTNPPPAPVTPAPAPAESAAPAQTAPTPSPAPEQAEQ